MAGRSSSKLKTLYLWKILREESDERNPMTAQALCQALLKEYGLEAERKSIYTSLKALQDAGFQVEQASPASRGWYMDEHLFEEPELLLLVDAVQSANILNEQKSQDLVNRLLDSSLSGPSKVRFLERFNFTANGNRPENNRALYHIETISRAIDEKKKLHGGCSGCIFVDDTVRIVRLLRKERAGSRRPDSAGVCIGDGSGDCGGGKRDGNCGARRYPCRKKSQKSGGHEQGAGCEESGRKLYHLRLYGGIRPGKLRPGGQP